MTTQYEPNWWDNEDDYDPADQAPPPGGVDPVAGTGPVTPTDEHTTHGPGMGGGPTTFSDPVHTGGIDPNDPTHTGGGGPRPDPTKGPETSDGIPVDDNDPIEGDWENEKEGDDNYGTEPDGSSPGQQGPFSEDRWSDFMDRFGQGLQWDIPTVSAGDPRRENAEVDAFQQYLMDQARKHMENPSRYDADLVRQGMDVVNAQIEEMRRTGSSAIDARMAQRGLAGSSLEGEQHQLHEAALDRHANERAFALNQDQARTWAQDRSSAFNMGLGAGQQAMTRDQQLMQQDIQNRALDLQAQGMNQDMAFRQAQLDWQMQHSAAQMGLDREAMLMDQDFRNRELDLREKGMDENEARWNAEMEWQKEKFAEDNDFRWAGLDNQQWNSAVQLALWMAEQDGYSGQSLDEILKQLMAAGMINTQGGGDQ